MGFRTTPPPPRKAIFFPPWWHWGTRGGHGCYTKSGRLNSGKSSLACRGGWSEIRGSALHCAPPPPLNFLFSAVAAARP